ncbi:Hybrid PKS-NRPS synthetase lepA [Cladobotryum mycophilum]|uniref:Hybrid PKS-NRPS synthetase lepA n=1 Tax=Cladobotryum mycophilum TaxID=491253 RepID=A0ABR0SWP0_9HYPO
MAEPIAIIGTACRFPGSASSPSKLWELLETPRDVVREYPPERMNFQNFHSEDGEAHGRTDVKNRAYLLEEDVRHFDAAFFRINPKEAAGMDPQQRILLETVYEAFESAGWTLDDVGGSQTSVHVGVMTDDWYLIQGRDAETLGSHAATGLSRSLLSNRISYAFDLKGPSMTVDTACSSSLVALHLAVQGIRKGEASQAIVAGTNLLMDPHWFITESSLHMLSPDSRSRMWDKDAKGYARGEGCAAVVLKSLSQAIKDGDHIECIIRETAVNQDGRTNGVTMPSPVAQASLIRQTYQNAGLDILTDRCQYFECHGTGTQAGDPVESQAIRDAFFPEPRNNINASAPLYCGSVKTVLGHLEGCAGLAGLLKASLAIQHKIIPPNLLFDELNPKVEPFYKNLQVPKKSIPWPETNNEPRRASVNSFGFGGTNAHAIIESYEPPMLPPKFGLWDTAKDRSANAENEDRKLIGPFLFSARSRPALANSLRQALEYIHVNPALDLDALSSILQSKRTAFSHRTAISAATNRQHLEESLEKEIQLATTSSSFGIRALNDEEPNRILGVFTGQGAQTAQMGRQLLEHCHLFRESIQKCQQALELLPEAPVWSIEEELNRDDANSRISQAVFSQPLCTAIQIALVDLLQSAGIRFAAVVGHSSGEIGAAYAAGVLNLRDAMGIAYYRGHVAHLAKGPGGKQGSMMAAALSFSDATALCVEPRFSGRISVAASNAPSSVTLSGDIDAIKEMKTYLDKKQIQTRQLKVDTAYHSHHMYRCADTYLAHLKQLNIHLQKPRADCVWSSSVRTNINMLQGTLDEQLKGQYWVDNMVNAVLFSEAVQYAVGNNLSAFAFGLEVGPHPALKGPVSQTLKTLLPSPLPYTSCLERGKPEVETVSEALGLLWSYLGPSAVDFVGWRKAFGLPEQVTMLKNLPSYPWDHDQIHWRESRISHNYRLGAHPPHSLLGRLHEDSQYEQTWRNILHLREMPWVRGHTFQGQILFPGAGYISLAVDAAKAFVKGRPIKLIEVVDVNIPKALTITEDSGVEILFTIRSNVRPSVVQDVLEAEFVCYSCPDERILDKTCDGKLVIYLGEAAPGDLPPSQMSQSELTPLSEDRFQRAISETGLGYDGVFRALHSISRTWGHAKAAASWAKGDLDANCTLHPALLDVAFQVGLATFISSAEKALGSSYLPVGIRRAIVDPNQDYQSALGKTSIDIESQMLTSDKTAVEVDINVYTTSGNSESCGIQIDGLILKALSEPQPSDDREIFVKTIWDVDVGSGFPTPSTVHGNTEQSIGITDAIERTALFYLQNIHREVRPEELASAKWYHRELYRVIGELLAPVSEGCHPILQEEWLDDTLDTIKQLRSQYPDSVDIEAITVVGENLPSVIRGDSEMLEAMTQNDLLTRLYKDSYPLSASNQHIAQIMRQISHKYPRTKILEIGAGTGATTLSVMNAIGDAYSSYTYTDISSSFFSGLAERLPESHASRAEFKKFNVELGPSEQGFVENSYDIIIAANVLHATSSLSRTLDNTRSLLRPGGFLIAMEVTGPTLFQTALMGGLEGWWLGVDEGRTSGPGISPKQWDDVLEDTGFSGVDCIVHDHADFDRHSCSVFVSQAVNDRINLLRSPLDSLDQIPRSPALILGGKTLAVSKIARRAAKTLDQWMFDVTTCSGIDELDANKIALGTIVLYLGDLDKAFWSEKPPAKRLENLQEMLGAASKILWVTSGRRLKDPYSNVMVGIGRALAVELPHLTMHFLDFDQSSCDVDTIMQQLLRLSITSSSEADENSGILWVTEPEVVIEGNQKLIPRVIQDYAANEALNAKRRTVSKIVEPMDMIEVAYPEDSTPRLLKSSSALVSPHHHIAIDVEMSVALHAKQEKPCFLCFGKIKSSGNPAVALSDIDASTISMHIDSIFTPTDGQTLGAEILVSMASCIIASQLLPSFPSYGRTLVYGASDVMAKAISAIAAEHYRKVSFVKVSATQAIEQPDCIVVHPRAAARTVQTLIPLDTAALLSFSQGGVDVITKSLPKYCIIHEFNSACIPQQSATSAASLGMAFKKLLSNRERLSTIIDWKRDGPVNSIIEPLQAHKIFSPNKTYFLVGMAGELGQSLCRFMVKGGAWYIVLASCNPKENPYWILELRLTGADVRIVKMDVSDRRQVRKTVAMLLFDAGIFVNYSAENINGTIHLDQEFANDKLDFFLTFGFLATVCGNPGQTMYHAGNMFMTSMVEKRRSRGLAATVLHFGLMVDVGYVTRTDRSDGGNIEERLCNFLLTPLAETEFHHLVLQGIMSGRPESASGEVIMGMAPYIDDGTTARPKWDESAVSMQQLHENLDKASNVDEAVEAVKELFYKKIEMMINVPKSSIDPSGPLADLGLDSLNGIDIRKWLMKEFHINMPLLRILGRESMTSLCASVAKTYMENNGHQTTSSSQEQPVLTLKSAVKPATPQPVERTLQVNTSTVKSKLMPAAQIEDSHDTLHDSDSETSTASIDTPLGSHARTPLIESKVLKTGVTTRIASPSSEASPSGYAKMRLPEPKESLALNYSRTERASFTQAGIHFMHTYLEDQTSFNVTLQYNVKGQLNVNRLTRAIEKALSHHDAYRTCFFPDPGSPQLKQHVASNIDLRRLTHITPDAGTADKAVQSAWEAITTRDWKFDLGETFHAVLVTHSPELHTIIFGFHLIASDAFSFSIFLRDLDRAYQMLPLSKNATSYLDFTRFQFEDLEQGRLEDPLEYWKGQLDPIPTLFPLLPLAKVKNRQARRVFGNHIVERKLDGEMVRKVREVSQAHRGTSMQFYLAAFQTLLARLVDVDDVCIGVTDSGRGRNGDFTDSVGQFANILPMRFRIRPDQSFAELVGRTSRTVLEAFDNAQVPFDVLLESLRIERSPVHTPLFQVAFNYRIGNLLQRPLGNCKMVIERHLDVKTAHDLTINITQTGEQGHLIEVITSDQLYSHSATDFIAETYTSLVKSLTHDQSIKVKSCKLYSNTQVKKAIALRRGSTMDHPWPKTLPQRFQQVYATVPNSVAIKDAEGQMTYGELARKIDMYSAAILDNGAAIGSRVAVLCEPSIDTYAIMLAILRIGAVYVPLDIKLPATRHRAMLDACKAGLLVFHAATTDAAVECYSNNTSDCSIRTLNISG